MEARKAMMDDRSKPVMMKRPKMVRTAILSVLTIEQDPISSDDDLDPKERKEKMSDQPWGISNQQRLYSSHFGSNAVPGPQSVAFVSVDGIPEPTSSLLRLMVWANFPYAGDFDTIDNPHIETARRYGATEDEGENCYLTVTDTDARIMFQYALISGRIITTSDPDLALSSGRMLVGLARHHDMAVYECSVRVESISLKHIATFSGMEAIAHQPQIKSMYLSADAGYVALSEFYETAKVYSNPHNQRKAAMSYIGLYEDERKLNPELQEYESSGACVLGMKIVPMSHSLLKRPQPQLVCILTSQYARFFKLKTCRASSNLTREELDLHDTTRMVERLVNLGEGGEW
uniref:Uncharacterized protein n=1 Tax=Lotharella oceanica TaxID=641309 RepID=A0A7S2XCR1_9EUKA